MPIKMEDLEEIKAPDSPEYFVYLIMLRNIQNGIFEITEQNPELKPALKAILADPNKPIEGVGKSLNQILEAKWAYLKDVL